MTVLQGSLFGCGIGAGPRPLAPVLQRRELGQGAWIDLAESWIGDADELFERLIRAVPWRAERRTMYDRTVDVPRLLAFYDVSEALPDEELGRIGRFLVDHYGHGFPEARATTGLCLYRHGRDSVAWHGDTIGRGASRDAIVAVISLGARRRFLLRPRGGGPTVRHELGGGDLLVMGGSCQYTWEHSVPKTARPVGPRISIQYRPPGVT
jgi:alkylated DNA repair dioxygenase AlkB